MDTGAVLGGTGLFLSLVGIIYSAINHKHIRSTCCGKEIDISIDIDSTNTGQKKPEKEEIKIPPENKIIKSHLGKIVPHFDDD